MTETAERVDGFAECFGGLRTELAKAFVGQDDLVAGVLTVIFAGGNCLLEGLPGLGKTFLIRTLGEVMGLKFSRIQFTPDLMPADITGTNIIVEDEQGRRDYTFRPGPIFAHLVLADEINRATPKTQSAMLEAMQEQSVTVWGVTHEIERPLFVLATQNPIYKECTYTLPEAQLDRFLFKLLVPNASKDELSEIVRRTTAREVPSVSRVIDREELLEWQGFVRDVVVAPHVMDFCSRLVLASHPDEATAPERVRQYLRFGASPRAAQAIVLGAKVGALLDGRLNVAFKDLRAVAKQALRHRLILTYQAQMDGVSADDLIDDMLSAVQET